MAIPFLMRDMTMAELELLYGLPGRNYRGLAPEDGRDLPPSVMSRQQRRAMDRALRKHSDRVARAVGANGYA